MDASKELLLSKEVCQPPSIINYYLEAQASAIAKSAKLPEGEQNEG